MRDSSPSHRTHRHVPVHTLAGAVGGGVRRYAPQSVPQLSSFSTIAALSGSSGVTRPPPASARCGDGGSAVCGREAVRVRRPPAERKPSEKLDELVRLWRAAASVERCRRLPAAAPSSLLTASKPTAVRSAAPEEDPSSSKSGVLSGTVGHSIGERPPGELPLPRSKSRLSHVASL